MHIVSRGQNVAVSEALSQHCEVRAQRALRPFSSHISRAQFVFVDLNGPRTAGCACRVTVELASGGRVRYEGRGDDFYRAASQAIIGTARGIQRALDGRRRAAVGVYTDHYDTELRT